MAAGQASHISQSLHDSQSEGLMRLQKFLARAGVASRRACEGFITEGRVSVNGTVVTELGTKVDPVHDEVRVDGAPVSIAAQKVTLMLYKPAGFLTSMGDERGRACVSELVPTDKYPGLYPVGRLDFDTTGLLLFSTDGELGNALLHPSRHVDKTYLAKVTGRPSKRELQALCEGVMLDDGPTQPAQVREVSHTKTSATLEIVIHEGRKRQVKRMCEAVGHPVQQLHRASFGLLSLGNLKVGEWRLLTDAEVASLWACTK